MKRRLLVLVTLLGVLAPAPVSSAWAEEPVPPLSSVAVPLTLPEPCHVNFRGLPDLPDRPVFPSDIESQWPSDNLDGAYKDSRLTAPPLPIGPVGASTVPAAWSDGGGGTVFQSTAGGMGQDRFLTADTQVAADDNFVVHATTSRIRIQSRHNDRPEVTYDLTTFLATPPDCTIYEAPDYKTRLHPDRWWAMQPTVYRDRQSGRWFVAASVFRIRPDGTRVGSVKVAVSQTSDPTAAYAVYSMTRQSDDPESDDPYFYDFPKLAVTDDKLVVAADVYYFNTFTGSQTLVVPKLPLLNGAPAVGADFAPDPGRRRMHPALQYNQGTAAYIAGLGANGTLVFDVVDGLLPGQVRRTSRSLAVTPWTAPPKAKQPLNGSLDSGGGVLQAPVFHQGKWWGSTTEGCEAEGQSSSFACVRMWQVAFEATGTPTLRQEFAIAEPGVDLTYPASVVDDNGTITTVLSRMNHDITAGIVVVGQAAGTPHNTISRPIRIVKGIGGFWGTTAWGTYAGAALAPDGQRVWLAHERANDGPWRTELVEVRSAPFTAWPSPARVSLTPGATGSSSVVLKSVAGWGGSASLAVQSVPAGNTVTLAASQATVPPVGTAAVGLTVRAGIDQPTDFVVTFRACGGGACQLVDVTVLVQQFAVSVSPPAPVIARGAGNVSKVTVKSIHGWSGTVSLDASSASSLSSGTLDQSALSVAAGGSSTASITLRAGLEETANEVPITIRACSSYCRTTQVRILVQQFDLYPSPSSVSISPGTVGGTSITVSSTNAWMGTVNLSVSGAPAGTTASLSPSVVTLGQYEAKAVSLTISLPSMQTGGFLLRITGCASFCRTTYVRVNLPPPSVSLSPETSTHYIPPGMQGDVMISVASVDGYNGQVSLSTSGMPSGSSATVSPSAPTVTPDAGADVVVTIRVGVTQATNFTVAVTARPPDGSFERTAYIHLHTA